MYRNLGRHTGATIIAGLAAALWVAKIATAAERDTIRQWQLTNTAAGGFELALKEVPRPRPARNQVAVRIHAVSLNRRDLTMRAGRYGRGPAGGTDPDPGRDRRRPRRPGRVALDRPQC